MKGIQLESIRGAFPSAEIVQRLKPAVQAMTGFTWSQTGQPALIAALLLLTTAKNLRKSWNDGNDQICSLYSVLPKGTSQEAGLGPVLVLAVKAM